MDSFLETWTYIPHIEWLFFFLDFNICIAFALLAFYLSISIRFWKIALERSAAWFRTIPK